MRQEFRAAMLSCAAMLLPATAAASSTAAFDYLGYEGDAAEVADGQFANPVLPGFHPDPSIVKVGDDFYMVNSTFSWFPGLPILHSRDLVNWKQIGNAIDRPGMVDLSKTTLTGDGLYAPAITYHDGTYYILNTCVRCDGNFLVTATDPAGPWSDPVILDFGGIDPSLYVDDDGRGWITYNDAPIGTPRYEGHRAIWIREFDLASNRLVGEPTLLVDGGVVKEDNPIWAEGPHIYKVDGWYYLLTAEGGTADQHSQVIYRTRDVTGPYEPGPVNPILTQRDLDRNRPDRVEATGHADFVQLDDGSWWGVFLGTRPYGEQNTLMGRETFLLPVTWEDGWPYFLRQGQGVPLVADSPALPAFQGDDFAEWRDDFDEAQLGPEWLRARGSPDVQNVMLGDGKLYLIPNTDTLSEIAMPAFVGQRMREHDSTFTTSVDFAPQAAGDFAGLAAVASEQAFVSIGVLGTASGPVLAVMDRNGRSSPANGAVVASTPWSGGKVELRIAFENGSADFSYRPAGARSWTTLASDVDVNHLASVNSNLFTGVVAGPYAVIGS